MRVYVSTDLEGISGVCTFEQTRERGTALNLEARRLLMGDVNALVDGLLEAGATRVSVMDGHGGGFNFIPELMHPKAEYITGVARPHAALGMHEGFDAGVLLGYHAMAGTEDGMLHHTQSSKGGNRYWYGGRESGEIAQSSLVMGHFNIPVIMVTGDDATCVEAEEFLGEQVVGVSVKTGYGRECGCLRSPAWGQEAIRSGAVQALGRVNDCEPFKMDFPLNGVLRFPDKETADTFHPRRSQRIDDTGFEATFETALEIYGF